MSDDPRTDFFAAGTDSTPESPEDSRTAFFDSEDIPETKTAGIQKPEPTYDAAEFKRRIGRDPEPAELANFKQFKGEGFANGHAQGSLKGLGEAALAAGAGTLKSISSAANDILPDWDGTRAKLETRISQDPILNYRGGPEAQPYLEGLNTVMSPVNYVARKAHQFISDVANPRAADIAGDVAILAPAARGMDFRGTLKKVVGSMADPEGIPETEVSGMNSQQSMGAARATPPIENASPQLRREVQQAARQTNGAINQTALENHLEADQHGVQLTEGQATRDPVQYSNEVNSTHPDIVKRIGDQNGQLTDALDNIRREAAPGAVHNNHIENGQTVVDALKAYDEPIKADIDAKYVAARKASATGDLQMDGSTFVSDANAALKPQSKFRFLPSTVKGILDDVEEAQGKMSLDDYEAYDTQLGNEIAKAKRSGDGNAAFAISKVQDALHRVEPIGAESAEAKSLFKVARASAKARFDAMRADPAYEATVDEATGPGAIQKGKPSPLADTFLDKYVLNKGAPKANVDTLMGKLDQDAREAVAAHTLNAIRKGAITNNGVVTPSGYAGALEKYGPKLESLVAPKTVESLDSLGRVIHNVKVAPPGHFVNSSKSGVISNAAHGVARPLGEAVINSHTFGMGVPIIKGISENSFAKRSLAPGAGLTKPVPSPPPIARATGGKVDHEMLVNRLIQRWKAAKKATDRSTAPLLKVPDAAIVKALDIAQEHI